MKRQCEESAKLSAESLSDEIKKLRQEKDEQMREIQKQLDSTIQEKSWMEQQLNHKNKQLRGMSQFKTQLKERVKCPVCLELPTRGPIYTCINGHCVCSGCYQGNGSPCPMCREEMVGSTSLLAVTVIKNLEHHCKHQGCDVKVILQDLEEHMKTCRFRLVGCPAIQCRKKVAYNLLDEHVASECRASTAKDEKTRRIVANSKIQATFSIRSTSHRTAGHFKTGTYVWKDRLFYLTNKPSSINRSRNLYMQMLGSEEDCAKVRIEYKVRDMNTIYAQTICEQPYSLDMTEEEKVDAGLVLSDKTLAKISQQKPGSQDLTYSVSIKLGALLD